MNRKSRKSRKIGKVSLVLGIAVAALSIGVPTALAEGRMAGTQEPDGVAFFKANEMSTLSQQNVSPITNGPGNVPQEIKALQARSEALNRQYGLGDYATTAGSNTYPDASERGLSKLYGSYLYGTGQGTGLSSYKDGAERAVPQPQSPNVTPISSDNELQWPQIGVGILIALILLLGIGLAFRTNRMRPAH